ncbi:uncharacterized protein LOC111393398 isoform X2 [Olea europaea var. sylvestris]|uniref:uncharacterized protein LOC111393398 isoform X2 n=1 Tax=Olea europaea var. sylvestris TaxID=158386 RepID=UPI000C1D6C77|nr:uncharacterized protein LOC111393398 isoform X2 [Olea europaea var. sylvestris]
MAGRRRIGEERLYYSPPAMRKYNQQQQQQQQLKSKSKSSPLPERRGIGSDSDDGAAPSKTNLDRFLEHTTPAVVAQRFPKSRVRGWRNRDSVLHSYFILGDLWDSFREWSVYGAGVPLVLNGNDSVVQYYVPYLSAMQLYVDPSSSLMEIREPAEVSDTDSSQETNSDDSSECEADRGANNTRGTWNQLNTTGQGYNEVPVRNKPFTGLSVDEGDVSNPPGRLIFEYLERDLPFFREPLADKISILASRFPELRTYRSCDLTHASWISIAWYPIYRIPVGSTLENIDACFLTFHSLATSVGRNEKPQFHVSTMDEGLQDAGFSSKLSLPTFGLASYKFKVSDWNADGVNECQKFDSLLRGADNWLRLLKVNHPDYSFFVSHNSYWI